VLDFPRRRTDLPPIDAPFPTQANPKAATEETTAKRRGDTQPRAWGPLGIRSSLRPARHPGSPVRAALESSGCLMGRARVVRLPYARDAQPRYQPMGCEAVIREPPTLFAMAFSPQKLLLAAPRGYCAGVDRAVQTVERALELYGAPVYVRKEIVHNKHVVEQLRDRGAVFVESEVDVPDGATVVFSAHGVAPSVHANAAARELHTIDATCPLVTKVHVEAKRFAAEGYTVVLVGHAGHEEVEGTMGEAPDHIVLIENEADVDALQVDDPTKVAYISQTTPSGSGSASPRSSAPAPMTSATPRPIGRRPSSSWPASATWCS
jgi:hypothetical protein